MRASPFVALGTFAAIVAACSSDRAGFSHPGAQLGNGPPSVCTENNRQIYLVTKENDLYRFAPESLALTRVGRLDCASGLATPFSMAVDRVGTAWVLFSDGHLFKVSTTDARCTPTAFEPGQQGFTRFGMAFATDGAGGESLFAADGEGEGLATIDTSTLSLSFVGSYQGAASTGELTGTGSGRLFAFFEKAPPANLPRIVELDRESGRITDEKGLAGTEIGAGWAFAHWGGDFWLFTAPGSRSQVDLYEYTTGETRTVLRDLDFVIVGAGVSTCAPVTRPK
jgi:hypothetical protein